MSALSPSRPSRRAATARRRAVIESSDEDDKMDVDNEAEEEFTPAPRRTTRTTRQSTAEAKTPKRTTRSRQSQAEDGESTILLPDETEPAKQQSPTKKASPRKRPVGRPSVRANRKQRASTQIAEIKEESAALPTPEQSASPEVETTIDATTVIDATTDAPKPASPITPLSPTRREPTPLADITEQAINEQPLAKGPEIAHVDPHATKLEKPMDIVIRTRQAALPKIEEQATLAARLVITYLVLTNFKSYAGRQEVGPFHASFSSVVGPNGSGKSNVIDSLLFVFGFRASKMRQGKLSALIHNSAAHPDADFCEVEVQFQEVKDLPDGGHEVIPDSKLVISRRAFKNNSSSYYINGRTSNFTTVTTLLKDRGIDLDHKRFLILQGEVESIAQMKPKAANEHDDGLLEYLEDIIGTSKYKTPIEEAAQETEQLNEVCAEKNSRVKHVEREKNGLEDKKNRALQYITDENDLAFKKSSLYQVYMQECNDNLEVSKDAASKVQAQLDEELRKHHGGEEEIKRLEKKYKSGSKEFDGLEKQAQALNAEMAKLDKESVKLEEKKKFLSNKQKKLEKSVQSSEFAAKDATVTISQRSDDIARLTAQISELESQMKLEEEELAAIRQSLQGKTEGLSNEIAAKQKSLEPWNEKINSKKSSMAVAQSELDILREKANSGALAIAEIEAKLVSFNESKAKKEEELNESRERIARTKEEVEATKKQLGTLSKVEPKLRSALSDACQKADEARASLSSSQTQGNVLAGLMHLKESGRISGFHGRLGNLGTIDSKYDIAISTACPSLDNLVVDNVEIGQQCIEYLRKNNLGRAHFILLDRLPHRDLSAIQTPENVPRLFDLVKSRDEKFRPAFYSVMQNTLVADTLEQANRIAYAQKRWRVVTLEGQLIDKSGTMSGGGTRVMKGAMSSKLAAAVSKDQVSKMEVDRDALERQLQDHLKQQRELNDALRDLNEQLPRLETMTQKLSMEISSIERNVVDSVKRIKEIGAEQNTTQSDKSRMASLEKTISSAEKDIAKLHSEMASIEAEIKALQDKIMEIGGVRLRGQKAKVDGLREQIDTMTSEMSNSDVSKAKAEKSKQKHEKALAEAKAELEKLASDFQKVDEDAKSQRDLVSNSSDALSAAQDELDAKKDELQSLKSELDAKTAELNECRGVEIEMRNKLEQIEKTSHDSRKRLAHWEEELGKLELKNTNDLGEEQEEAGLPTHSRDELLDIDRASLKDEIAQLEAKLQKVTDVDLGVLREYRRRVEEHATRSADLAESLASRDTAKKRCDELRKLRLEGFMEGFSIISMRLKEMYQMITMGGNAELELVDSLDPFSEGILFSVMPPKKSWKNISNLSGGEKTLSSLALVFALHHYKPTPLYVMDEIDAALDFRNVSIVASYIKERTKNGQFIVISLRNNMFELASRLVGVYKVNHMTKSVTIENKDYLTPA